MKTNQSIKACNQKITQSQKEIIIGSLLGDGYLVKTTYLQNKLLFSNRFAFVVKKYSWNFLCGKSQEHSKYFKSMDNAARIVYLDNGRRFARRKTIAFEHAIFFQKRKYKID